jgi:serine/threonine protein kinase
MLSRFQREAKLLIKLDHPNVVRAFQFGESAGKHYFVMEYLDGQTLDEILSTRKRLPPAEAIQIVYQAMRGMEHIHSRNMVHRDIKPANLILIPSAGSSLAENTLKANVKLLDIGLGKTFFDEHIPIHEAETQLTSEGVLLGTPDYMSPEQAKNASAADIRADIYSLGCVLYHCLTGQPPFPDRNLMNQIIRHATETAKPLKDMLNPVPEGLQAVIDIMLAKEPEKRYQTPEKAAQALKLFLKHLPEAPVSPEPSAKYLKWLQIQSSEQKKLADTLALKATDSGPRPRPNPAKLESPRTPPTAEVSKARTKEASPAPKPIPKLEPLEVDVEPVSEEFDVELVPDQGGAAVPIQKFALSRRDFAMLGIGAAGGLLIAGIGYVLSQGAKKEKAE